MLLITQRDFQDFSGGHKSVIDNLSIQLNRGIHNPGVQVWQRIGNRQSQRVTQVRVRQQSWEHRWAFTLQLPGSLT
ncbi:hypothetical protein FQZ97_1016690 [compost metagenome]